MKRILIVCIVLIGLIGIVTAFTVEKMPYPKWLKGNPWPPEDIIMVFKIPGLGGFTIDIPKHDFNIGTYQSDWMTKKDYDVLKEKWRIEKMLPEEKM